MLIERLEILMSLAWSTGRDADAFQGNELMSSSASCTEASMVYRMFSVTLTPKARRL